MTEFWIIALGSGFTLPKKFTRNRGEEMMRDMLPSMRVTMGELVGWMQTYETTAEYEAFVAGLQWEDEEDAWEDEDDDEGGCGPQ